MAKKEKSELETWVVIIVDSICAIWFAPFYFGYVLAKVIIEKRPFGQYSQKRFNRNARVFGAISIVIGLIVAACYAIPGLWSIVAVIAAVIASPLVLAFAIRIRRKKIVTGALNRSLIKALKVMDSTANWYNDENEANRELVSCLKAQGMQDVVYQYRLDNGRIVDARVEDWLIEGKLSPDTAGIDRLLGQLSEYTSHSKKLNVVVYGHFQRDARRRLENEIRSRYRDRVFLTYLNNPKRIRLQNDD